VVDDPPDVHGPAACPRTGQPLPHSRSPALEFRVLARDARRARAAALRLPHHAALTPCFMPVGTQGSVKGLTPAQLLELDCHVVLGNTYHLGNRPGAAAVAALGGLHALSGWPRAMLTDSGGFQMVSLLHLAQITERGVEFASPVDGSRMLLTPEQSVRIQNALGADILMALDDVVPATCGDGARFAEATGRTTRWLDRCLAAHARPGEQSLFPIVQGGFDVGLRSRSLRDLVARDAPGYAIGGLAGGETKDAFWRVVAQCAAGLPQGKPRYVMGIGYPLDIVVCTALGCDMYDSVYPTRTARFGVALTDRGQLRLRHAAMASDPRPIDPGCGCMVCRRHTRAYLHATVARGLPSAASLVSYHNVAYTQGLTRRLRAAIRAGALAEFVRAFVGAHFGGDPEAVPQWVVDALDVAGIDLGGVAALRPAHDYWSAFGGVVGGDAREYGVGPGAVEAARREAEEEAEADRGAEATRRGRDNALHS